MCVCVCVAEDGLIEHERIMRISFFSLNSLKAGTQVLTWRVHTEILLLLKRKPVITEVCKFLIVIKNVCDKSKRFLVGVWLFYFKRHTNVYVSCGRLLVLVFYIKTLSFALVHIFSVSFYFLILLILYI